MVESKIAIFVDTNVFEKKGLNFDSKNQLIGQYISLLKNENLENVCVSVVDNEIKQHINKRIEESKKVINKHCKWIYNLLEREKINENLNKNLLDYEKFKQDCNTIYLDLQNINPEVVMKKYFELRYPFELAKPNEFKDAFFLEAIYQYAEKNDLYANFIVVSNDSGIKKSIEEQLNKKIVCFE